MKRPCLDCRKVFEVARRGQSRCESCLTAHRAATPPRDEPWRALYRERSWHRARALALRRDDHRCRALLPRGRCSGTGDVQVHHDLPLEHLWHSAGGDYDLFVATATELPGLFTLCRKHHAEADAMRRRITQSSDWT